MRLDKFVSMNGFGSRKQVRQMIKSQRVQVNNIIIKDAGFIINTESDIVTVDDTPISFLKDIYLMLNKPAGYICEHNPVEYPSVLELLKTQRNDLFFVGRLDADTEGLLLITNDGQFSHQIAHGKKDMTKTYEVHLKTPFDDTYIAELERGIILDGDQLKPAQVVLIEDNIIHLTISEGKYHQVKRMMLHCNNEVHYLKRLSIGQLNLDPTLNIGQYKQLSKTDINTLLPNYIKD